MKYRLLCCLLALTSLSPLCVAEWKFFAMDTGTRDGQTRSYEQQAALVKELGFSGIGYTGATRLSEMFAAVDKHGSLPSDFLADHLLMIDPSLLASPIVQVFGGLSLVLWIAQLLFTLSIAQARVSTGFYGVLALCSSRCWPSWRFLACQIASSDC